MIWEEKRKRISNKIRWLTSTNAKDIGVLYIIFGIFSFIVATTISIIMRLELADSGIQYINNIKYNQIYNVLITGHGLLMVFYAVMPVLIGGFGNYYVPILIGSLDMSMPRLNNISFWLLVPSLLLLVLSNLLDNGPGIGWTAVPPLSSLVGSSGPSVDCAIFALHLAGISSIIGSINIITTIWNVRVKKMEWHIVPLFVWTVLVTTILIVLTLPILAVAITLLLLDRNINTSFYIPENGGDVMIYLHLFWLLGHPEVIYFINYK